MLLRASVFSRAEGGYDEGSGVFAGGSFARNRRSFTAPPRGSARGDVTRPRPLAGRMHEYFLEAGWSVDRTVDATFSIREAAWFHVRVKRLSEFIVGEFIEWRRGAEFRLSGDSGCFSL